MQKSPDDEAAIENASASEGIEIVSAEDSAAGIGEPRPDLGVVFIHGIGQHRRGTTLVAFGDALVRWLRRWSRSWSGTASTAVNVNHAFLRRGPRGEDQPASAVVELGNNKRWLLVESWWAETFEPPRYGQLARWGLQVAPWAIVSHFRIRLRRAAGRLGLGGIVTIKAFVRVLFENIRASVRVLFEIAGLFLATFVGLPLLLLVLLLLMFARLVPIKTVRSAVGRAQAVLVASLGDSFIFLDSPLQSAAITSRIRRDLEWTAQRVEGGKVAVVAHSQGASVAVKALTQTPHPEVRKLITFGAGINKLTEIQRIADSTIRWVPLLMVRRHVPVRSHPAWHYRAPRV